MANNRMRAKDRFSAVSHFVGAILAIIGTIYLLVQTHTTPSKFLVGSIYVFSIIFFAVL